MKFEQIAEELCAGCREGRASENLDKLYAKDAVSVESQDFGGQGRESKGIDAIRGKHAWWAGAMDEHSTKVDGPFIHADEKFSVLFDVDATDKESGKRFQMQEVGVYTVEDGKIAREEFFGRPNVQG